MQGTCSNCTKHIKYGKHIVKATLLDCTCQKDGPAFSSRLGSAVWLLSWLGWEAACDEEAPFSALEETTKSWPASEG